MNKQRLKSVDIWRRREQVFLNQPILAIGRKAVNARTSQGLAHSLTAENRRKSKETIKPSKQQPAKKGQETTKRR